MEIFYHISWRRSSSEGGSCTTSTVQNGQLIGSGSLTCKSGCSGTISSMRYKCTDFSTTENWSFGENIVYHTFSVSLETITIGFSSCCWISPFNSNWNLPTTFSLIPRNDTGVINSTPRATTSPVIRLQQGCNHTIQIPVTDPDDDVIKCRWADGTSECGGVCNGFSGAKLDTDSCTITYEANEGVGYKAMALTIEDFRADDNISVPLSKVGLQFLVLVFSSDQSCTTSPVFRSPTIRNSVCVAVLSNDTFTTQVIADSHSADASISEIITVSPSGTIKGEIEQIEDSNLYYVNISWAPSAAQHEQTHLLCYTAVNMDGVSSEQSCIKIYPGISPPEPIFNSTSPENNVLVHPSETTWSVEFDKNIQRPSVTSYIKFHNSMNDEIIHEIDSSSSSEVNYNQTNTLLVTPNFNFPERTLFYVTLERGVVNGYEGCKPGNEPITDKSFWRFETLDVTPPEINFLQKPTLSNANASIKWTSNENVTWNCTLTNHLQLNVTVNCHDGSWKGLDLSEGEHVLVIEAIDEYSNKAVTSHTFTVDLTPPVASFTHKPMEISNEQSALLKFKCNEDCSAFDCSFSTTSLNEYVSCDSSVYTTSALEHNTTYNISVRGTDLVGNQGNWTYYEWKTDFEPPIVYGVIDTNISCEAETTPENTGQAQASDDISAQPKLSYSDNKTPCFIKRTWSANDEAGNTAILIQIITLDFSPTVSLAPVYFQPCDSANDAHEVSDNTASALNPCKRSLDLTHVDSTSEFTCPGNFTRFWTVVDDCTQVNSSASQSVLFYDVCPSHACGKNETIPHGACIFGECSCFDPWYGENCDVLIYKPVIQGNLINVILQEGQTYEQIMNISQGTPPLVWSLVSGPSYLSIDKKSGKISWLFAIAGNHSVSVQVQNTIGTATVEWNVQVVQGYMAILDPVSPNVYPKAGPITFNGHVEYIEGNVVKSTLASIVSVHINIWHNNVKRTMKTFTEKDGTFIAIFYPAPTEFGTYTTSAKHPQSSSMEEQTEWFILGMAASPPTVTLDSSTVEKFNKTFYDSCTLTNSGPLALHGLTYTVSIENIPTLSVQVHFNSAVDILVPGDAVKLDIFIESEGPIQASFLITIESLNETFLHIPVFLKINKLVPVLAVNPGSLINARVNRGFSKIFTFNVANVGEVAATSVQAILPSTNFMSLISLGSEEQPEGQLDLLNGQNAIMSILVKTSSDQELGKLSGNIVVSAEETSVGIYFSILISSNIDMNLTIAVEDEYTYFAAGKPLVDGAIVRLINYPRKIDLTLISDNGTVTFFNIPEDRYELFIDGPNHRSLKQVITTDINTPLINVFILRSAVTYSWTVTPVTFTDTYKISVEADFETHVPIPVVTVTPTEIDLEGLELGLFNTFQLNITNHGLIKAEDVEIQLPDHPFLDFILTADVLGDLDALSSVTVGVQVIRKEKKRAIVQAVVYIAYALDVIFKYVCGDLITKLVQVQLLKKEYKYNEISVVTQFKPNYIGGGGGFNGPGVYGGFTPISATTPVFCNKCLQTVVSCIPSLSFRVKLFPGASFIPTIVSGQLPSPSSVLEFILGFAKNKHLSNLGTGIGIYNTLDGIYTCLSDAYKYCISPYIGKRSLKATIPTVIEGLYTANLSNSLLMEIFGSDPSVEPLSADPDWLKYVLYPAFDDESDQGLLISQMELLSMQNMTLPNGSTIEDIAYLIQRLNNTFYGWNHGMFEPTNNSNMVSLSTFNDLSAEINFYNDQAIKNGYDSYLDAYESAVEEVNGIEDIESESGVCAVVRIRIEQELAITREAFLARLDIENNEDSPLTQIRVEIFISDASNGINATFLFSIGDGTASGSLMTSDNGWTLSSTESGSAEWLIVPYSEAAPTIDLLYDVGGTLSYMLDNEEISIPLLPTKVTVTPDPSLRVHYFWEKYVIGDNPFTTEKIEPSVPFSLGVGVRNTGYGTAFNLQITSAQPEIIENEKGLLVNFKIIGNTIGNQSFVPSMVVNFGDLASNTTVVARWWMLSSLQGKFMNYSATFENVNPLGDPKLSILDELVIHELIKSVNLNTPSSNNDDGILDFLVNDKKDINSYPDTIYSSKDLSSYSVNQGEVLAVNVMFQQNGSVSVSMTTFANNTGWTYFIYEDMTGTLGDSPAAGLNTTKTVDNETVYLPIENSWKTTSQQTEEQSTPEKPIVYFHILDYVDAIGEVTYMLNPCSGSLCPDSGRIFEQPIVPTVPSSSVTPGEFALALFCIILPRIPDSINIVFVPSACVTIILVK